MYLIQKRLKDEIIWYFKKLIDKAKNDENILSLEVLEVVSVQCNFVDNQYQQQSEVYYYSVKL